MTSTGAIWEPGESTGSIWKLNAIQNEPTNGPEVRPIEYEHAVIEPRGASELLPSLQASTRTLSETMFKYGVTLEDAARAMDHLYKINRAHQLLNAGVITKDEARSMILDSPSNSQD